jgi:beta-glucosidase-like glycosyl hydrolase
MSGCEILAPAGGREALVAAVQSGAISEDQINDACLRVLRWKEALGLIG